ncbi:MAG: phenylalanine--tRNA ligase subunit alpha [Patescibacteria group bacterium]
MNDDRIKQVKDLLIARLDEDKSVNILRAKELKDLYSILPTLPDDQRASFGQGINQLKKELEELVEQNQSQEAEKTPIDITAPMDVNADLPEILPANEGSVHPTMREIAKINDIFSKMGFETWESRYLDNDYNMFTSLNFPEDHPARDDYDTFITEEGLIAPAHTSTMQNRIYKARKEQLESGKPIAVVVADRVFRNEDLDARHEHTFHQLEGVYVSKNVNVGNLIATLEEFLSSYFGKKVESRVNPFYFPFTEPSFEFSLSCPFCDKKGCSICSQTGWIELLGCGMIHPNVLSEGGIDPKVYSGFAWGLGIERLIMMKYGIEDVRHFQSAKLDFLRQFA